MFKGLQKVLINFGVNVILANAFSLLITNEEAIKAYLLGIINSSIKPGSINFVPGDDDATKKSYVILASSYVIGAIFDYLILNQDAIKKKLEPIVKV